LTWYGTGDKGRRQQLNWIEAMAKKPKRKQEKKKTAGRRNSKTFSPSKDQLARVALGLFADRHFGSVGIRDIAEAAKLNSSMLYYHFKDKDDLYRAAIESAIDEAFQLYAEHCNTENHENPGEAISAWFDVHVKLYKQLRNVIKISLDCKGVVPGVSESKQPIKRFYRHERAILEELVREGVRRGLFRKDLDPSTVATMVSTMLDGVLARSIFLKDFNMHETVEAFKQAILLYLDFRGEDIDAVHLVPKGLPVTQ
jgi:AcrR family transcriptional regulator